MSMQTSGAGGPRSSERLGRALKRNGRGGSRNQRAAPDHLRSVSPAKRRPSAMCPTAPRNSKSNASRPSWRASGRSMHRGAGRTDHQPDPVTGSHDAAPEAVATSVPTAWSWAHHKPGARRIHIGHPKRCEGSPRTPTASVLLVRERRRRTAERTTNRETEGKRQWPNETSQIKGIPAPPKGCLNDYHRDRIRTISQRRTSKAVWGHSASHPQPGPSDLRIFGRGLRAYALRSAESRRADFCVLGCAAAPGADVRPSNGSSVGGRTSSWISAFS